ncbi:hypothetical protein QQ045_014910 [Rhodiola kirilowii]
MQANAHTSHPSGELNSYSKLIAKLRFHGLSFFCSMASDGSAAMRFLTLHLIVWMPLEHRYQILISNDRNAFKVPEILLSQMYSSLATSKMISS